MKKLIKKLESLANVTFIQVKQAETIYGESSSVLDYSISSDVSNSLDNSKFSDISKSHD
jgi:hypothetical protein